MLAAGNRPLADHPALAPCPRSCVPAESVVNVAVILDAIATVWAGTTPAEATGAVLGIAYVVLVIGQYLKQLRRIAVARSSPLINRIV